jgi:hypothetical protein
MWNEADNLTVHRQRFERQRICVDYDLVVEAPNDTQ